MEASNDLINKTFDDCLGLLTDGQDKEYFKAHERRFRHSMKSILSIVPAGARILDVGSHYLHQSALLRLLGFEVWAIDVPEFAEIDFVRQRAQRLDINLSSAPHLEKGQFLSLEDGSFDLILFCEILEHITFNPVDYWQRIHHLMRIEGRIYLTTPNSLRLINVISTLKRTLFLSGIGIDVPSILGAVTYGHHWKEYSKKELLRYFSLLSPDFLVDVRFYNYRPYPAIAGVKDLGRHLARMIGEWLIIFDEELEVVVTLNRRSSFTAKAPAYG